MDRTEVWQHIHAERAALARTLSGLDEAQWQHDTLCTGWTVHDVAAHVIAHPQIGWAQLPGMVGRNLGRGYNAMVFREVKRLAARETRESILADFDRLADSTRRVPITTSLEPLVDALVHHQDIVRPLGIRHDMHPGAAAVAADRVRQLAFLMGSRRLVRSVRMVATDVDWARGRGPTVEGPMQELLMLCAGRAGDPALLAGDGCELLMRGRRTSR
jgi:uncharacterized protein (TIGR03083 family)